MTAIAINYLTLDTSNPRSVPYRYINNCFSGFYSRKPSKRDYNSIVITIRLKNSHLPVTKDLIKAYPFLDVGIVEGDMFKVQETKTSWSSHISIVSTQDEKLCKLKDYSFVFRRKDKQKEKVFSLSVLIVAYQLRFLSSKEMISPDASNTINNYVEKYLNKKNRKGKDLFKLMIDCNEVFIKAIPVHSILTVENNPWHKDLELVSNEEVLKSITGTKTISMSKIITEARKIKL